MHATLNTKLYPFNTISDPRPKPNPVQKSKQQTGISSEVFLN